MPLTLVQRKTNQSAAAVASLAGTFAPAPTVGNLLVVNANSDATLTMTSSGWTLTTSSVNDTGLYQWHKIAGASESATVTVTPSVSASTEIVLEEWSGNLSSSPLDKFASGVQATGAATVPSGTTTTTAQADELAVAAFGWNDAGVVVTMNTYSNSYAEVSELKGTGGTATNIAVAELDLLATGTQTTTGTLSGTTSSVKSGLIGTYMAAALAVALPAPQPILFNLLGSSVQPTVPVFWAPPQSGALVTPPDTLSLSGIATAEAFDTPGVTLRDNMNLAGIASGEALAALKLLDNMALAGIATAEAVSAINLQDRIAITGIASGEALSALSLLDLMTLAGIASGESVPSVSLGATDTINLSGIASAEALSALKLQDNMALAGIASGEALSALKLQDNMTLAGVATGESVPAIFQSAIGLVGIASAEVVPPVSVSEPAVASPERGLMSKRFGQ